MTPAMVGLLLHAAVLHASWNALLRSGADRLWSMTIMSFATTAVALPFALLLPLPAISSWPYLGLSVVLEVGYSLFLVQAFAHGELGQVYPIARGCAPLLVTLGAALFASEHLSFPSLTGIVLISVGVMSLAGTKPGKLVPFLLALTTGAFIASYTVTDGIGVRLAGGPRVYAVWIFVLYGTLLPLVFLAIRRRLIMDIRSPETWKALAGGLISLTTYFVVIYALALNPIGPVSALRETSVVFAALIGRVFLAETLTMGRLGACLMIAFGVFCFGRS